MEVSEEKIQQAILIAKNARENAFTIRSNHAIGACVITTDGHYYGGCNIESDISGLGICAERCAIDHAVLHGKYEYLCIVIVDNEYSNCCGACLQYIELFSQIGDFNPIIVSAELDGTYQKSDLYSLLPKGYRTNDKLSFIQSFKNKNNLPIAEI